MMKHVLIGLNGYYVKRLNSIQFKKGAMKEACTNKKQGDQALVHGVHQNPSHGTEKLLLVVYDLSMLKSC